MDNETPDRLFELGARWRLPHFPPVGGIPPEFLGHKERDNSYRSSYKTVDMCCPRSLDVPVGNRDPDPALGQGVGIQRISRPCLGLPRSTDRTRDSGSRDRGSIPLGGTRLGRDGSPLGVRFHSRAPHAHSQGSTCPVIPRKRDCAGFLWGAPPGAKLVSNTTRT